MTGLRTLRNDPLSRVDGMIWSVPHSDGRPGLRLRLESFKRATTNAEFEAKTQINLQDEQVEELFRYLVEERHLAGFDKTTDYVVVRLDREVPDTSIVLRLLTYFQSDPRVFLRMASEIRENDLSALVFASNLVRIQRTAKELEALIDAARPEQDYQRWFEDHPWVFGSEYVERIPMRTIGLDSQADVLLRSADGFMDVFEIKLPRADVLVFDRSHSTWKPSADLSEAFGQALKYLDTISEQQLILQTRFGVTAYRPRIRIVAGRSLGWEEDRKRTVRAINAHWHGIELLTYDMVLTRAKNVISYLVKGLA
jgi:hypothetical protein